jgi:DNA-directed RNA polymerase III subunit RPC2
LKDELLPPRIPKKRDNTIPPNFRKFLALGKDGIVRVGSKISKGDVFMNKQVPDCAESIPYLSQDAKEAVNWKPAEAKYDGGAPSYAERVIVSSTPDNPVSVKMIAR